MKIAKELLILTREHHTALSLANKCINTAKSKNNKLINDLCLIISKNFKQDFYKHFETEESTIFVFLSEQSIDLKKICNQLILEHQQLYKMANELSNNPVLLEKFGQLLKSHARLEDRQLFPNINKLSTLQKQKILDSSSKHLS